MSDLSLQLSHLDFDGPHQEPSNTRQQSSFQALLSQNEDLAARLRVTLQKLANTEKDLQKNTHLIESLTAQLSGYHDQILIWKEKERIWQERHSQLEKTNTDRERALEIESSLLRQKAEIQDKLEDKLDRYQKYHEKIKTSVKPYIGQLKGYALSLQEQTRSLNQMILQKEIVIENLEQRLHQIQSENETLTSKTEADKNQLISMFEDERQQLQQEVAHLHIQNDVLLEKTRMLDSSLERQDELENLIVALRRTKDDLSSQYQQDLDSLREQSRQAETELTLKRLQAEDQTHEIARLRREQEVLSESHAQTQEQLISLRYMWNQKSQENEKLKQTVQSLENINLELSQKLNGLRQELEIS